jgi:hypothetical protein
MCKYRTLRDIDHPLGSVVEVYFELEVGNKPAGKPEGMASGARSLQSDSQRARFSGRYPQLADLDAPESQERGCNC